MSVSKEKLERMIGEIGGPELSDADLEQVMAQVKLHQEQGEKLRQLDLSKALPARLMRAS